MPKTSKGGDKSKRRTQVKELSGSVKKLSPAEQKRVKGGATRLVTRPTGGTGASGGGSGDSSIWPADRENG